MQAVISSLDVCVFSCLEWAPGERSEVYSAPGDWSKHLPPPGDISHPQSALIGGGRWMFLEQYFHLMFAKSPSGLSESELTPSHTRTFVWACARLSIVCVCLYVFACLCMNAVCVCV